jgi:hypothetical protein
MSVVFSPDGKRIAAAGFLREGGGDLNAGTVKVWDWPAPHFLVHLIRETALRI